MTASYSLLLLPGDGIGPEVMRQVRRVIEWLERKRGFSFQVTEALVGGCSIDAHGVPLTPQVLEKAKSVDAVMLGAVGGPKWDGGKVPFEIRPEAALLALRKELGLFANLRPATVFDALVDASTLKAEVVKGLDIMIVRELTGGVYFGEPRGISDLPNGERIGVNTQSYTTSEIRRVAAVAFELARKRNNKVHSVEKCNVMESGLLWRQEVTKLHQEAYSDVVLEHMLADNCAMQLLKNPKQFDVIVTDNLFGDMLSDEASMLTGSLGMLPSASLGAPDANGKRKAMYEPIHGSAPDIAGRDVANPLATLLSLAMALRYSFNCEAEAVMIETAVQRLLAGGLRTADIMQPGMARCSTTVMGDTILRELDKLQAA